MIWLDFDAFASAATGMETEVGAVGEKTEEGGDQDDPWKKLKDFAG